MRPLTNADVEDFLARLALDPTLSDGGRIDRIAVLERVKGAAAAAQARVAVDFKVSQLAAQEAAGVPARRRGEGISAQVALARRESPHKGARLVGLAEALVGELPHTLAALESGETSEWRATLVAKATACLSAQDRRAADRELAGRLGGWGDRQVEAEANKIAYRLDPHAFLARSRRAETERRVTLRPAPDQMTYLGALLPLKQGVAAYAALKREADTAHAAGDERSRSQVMADTLVERVTGQATADQVPVEVQLVLSDHSLCGDSDDPGTVTGFGPVPAPWARALVRDTRAAVWIRRLYTDRARLVALESTRRLFPDGIRALVTARDQVCRTPWCDAPIRHLDHVVGADAGGETSEANGQGLCEACNHAKQAAGWHSRPGPFGAGREVVIATPTGHRYRSRPPDPPGAAPPSVLEAHFASLLAEFVAA